VATVDRGQAFAYADERSTPPDPRTKHSPVVSKLLAAGRKSSIAWGKTFNTSSHLGTTGRGRRLKSANLRHGHLLAASCGPGVCDRMTVLVEQVDCALQAVQRRLPMVRP